MKFAQKESCIEPYWSNGFLSTTVFPPEKSVITTFLEIRFAPTWKNKRYLRYRLHFGKLMKPSEYLSLIWWIFGELVSASLFITKFLVCKNEVHQFFHPINIWGRKAVWGRICSAAVYAIASCTNTARTSGTSGHSPLQNNHDKGTKWHSWQHHGWKKSHKTKELWVH